MPASITCAIATGCRSSMLRNGRRIPGKSWGVTRRAWLGSQRFERSAQAAHLRDLPASARPGRPPDRGARARHRGARRGGAVAQARRPAALPARDRHPDSARDRGRSGRLRALRLGRGVHGLCGSRPLRALLRRQPQAGIDHQGWQLPSAPPARRGGLEPAGPPAGWVPRSPAVSAGRTRSRSSAPGAVSSRMQGRGKPRQKIVVALARELAGFVWATATDQPLRRS